MKLNRSLTVVLTLCLCFTAGAPSFAKLKLPSIIGNNMVLQRDQPLPIWGWDDPGREVTVEILSQRHKTKAGEDGRWQVTLEPLETANRAIAMTITGSSQARLLGILVGEVWLCSGQSNMQYAVSSANDPDLESASANFPRIRLITVPQVGTQEPQNDFEGKWERCTPESVKEFSAVGFFFGRLLHQTLDVPIGLIDNSWGGSAAEAWVRRDILEGDALFKSLIEEWRQTESTYNAEKEEEAYRKKVAEWEERATKAKEAGKDAPARPAAPRNPLKGQHRPGNLYAGVLHPIIGYGIRGAIWYQGETNASRAWNYRHLFPLMISHWRDEWGQGDFPFYWVQLADFQAESVEPGDSQWAELREAQTMTMSKLPNTGEAVIIDLGEASDIHPRNKQDVAKRLARWALANQYGRTDLVYRSPIYKSMEKKDGKVVVTFDYTGGGLDTFDVREPIGFAIAGADRKFVWADAKIVGADRVEVWSDQIAGPEAVRYAWNDNPVCNLQNKEGLQVTPFRTDDWPMITKPLPEGEQKPVPAPEVKVVAKPEAQKPKPKPKPEAKTPAKPKPE